MPIPAYSIDITVQINSYKSRPKVIDRKKVQQFYYKGKADRAKLTRDDK